MAGQIPDNPGELLRRKFWYEQQQHQDQEKLDDPLHRLLLLPPADLHGHAQAAELVASVDRSRLNSGETVELTLESSDVTQFGKPDLTPLEPLFEVRGTRQVNQLNTLNGDNRATTRWIITLLPKENGSVVIPPLQLGECRASRSPCKWWKAKPRTTRTNWPRCSSKPASIRPACTCRPRRS
jgi:hypothetical protein